MGVHTVHRPHVWPLCYQTNPMGRFTFIPIKVLQEIEGLGVISTVRTSREPAQITHEPPV